MKMILKNILTIQNKVITGEYIFANRDVEFSYEMQKQNRM